MNRKLYILFLLILFCSITSSQNTNSTAALYNKGKLTVTGGSLLYIDGKLTTDSESEDLKSSIRVDESNIILRGNFINNVQHGTVFDKTGITTHGTFELRGDREQLITTDGKEYSTIPSKTTNFIDFPNLLINNSEHIKITPEIAAQTEDIELQKGWLIIDSRKADADKDYADNETANSSNNTVFAHLYTNGSISYQNWDAPDVNERGFIQVNMALENEGDNIVNGKPVTSLVGFGSPFTELRADYFMFNNLVQPDHTGFFGSFGRPNPYPQNILYAGRGNVLAIDMNGSDFSEYNYEPPYGGEANFDERAKDGLYYFNRHRFSDPAASEGRYINNVFGNNTSQDAFTKETIVNNSVNIQLKAGFNYLSNPFMTPLNISTLLENSASNPWNVIIDDGTNGSGDIYNAVWIMNPDSKAEYLGLIDRKQKAKYYYHYYVAQNPGGTYSLDEIAPLQMFVIWAERDVTITIPLQERRMGNTKFIRAAEKSFRKDDFIIEVIDGTTKTSDRTNFVLRPAAEITARYSGRNLIRENTIASNDKNESINQDVLALASQLFTKDKKGNPLMVNFLPLETTDFVPLYLKPSSVRQEITLQGLRINTISAIEGIWLEDKREQLIIPFTEETKYSTNTDPTDSENRFIIHFKEPVNNPNNDNTSSIIGYYKNKNIILEGFIKEYIGSSVYLYGVNGSLISHTIADQYKIVLNGDLSTGIYLIKITGKKSQSIKLIIDQG